MTHVIEKEFLLRANGALLRTAIVGGMAGCALGAAFYDFGKWLGAW